MNTDQILGSKLREIRKQTGMNQEKFFEEYLLKYFDITTKKKESSKNDDNAPEIVTMRKYESDLENGKRPLPASALPLLSKLSGHSIDDLFGDLDIEDVEIKKVGTVSDLLSILFGIEQGYNDRFSIRMVKEYQGEGFSYDIPCIHIANGFFEAALIQWKELQDSSTGENLKVQIIDTWKKGILSGSKNIPIGSTLADTGEEIYIPYSYNGDMNTKDLTFIKWNR